MAWTKKREGEKRNGGREGEREEEEEGKRKEGEREREREREMPVVLRCIVMK